MLWLCFHLPHLPLSALGAETGDAVVIDQRGSQRWLITPSAHSAAGTAMTEALRLQPDLRVRARKVEAERETLRSLAYAAYRYGQPVCAALQDLAEPGRVPRALLWVEIGRSLNLFGGIESLRDSLCSEWLELGHAAQLGIAPTRAGAALLACAGQADPVGELQALRTRLDDLPLRLLHWPAEVLSTLQGVGFGCLREVFDVPREAFSKRFGAEYRLALDRLLGDAPEPFEAIVPPETFRRRFELSAEIEEVERLHFPLRRLCTELQGYLRACDRGLRSVTLAVTHANARVTQLHARFVDPHRDAKRIFDSLCERLERDGLPLPARELILIAEDFAEASVPQTDLFDTRAGQQQNWNAAIERLRARLGDAKLWIPQAVEDHRPECSTRQHFSADPVRIFHPSTRDHHRPVFLATRPWPMPSPEIPPGTSFERVESGWWDGQEIRRDYTTLDIDGTRTWVFREIKTGNWFLQGWWS